MPIIQLDNVRKEYRAKGRLLATALDGVTCAFETGTSYAVMGASGSGKTTLLNVIAGLVQPSSGACSVLGKDVATLPDRAKCRLRNEQIGLLVQDFALLEEETALANCVLPALMAGKRRKWAVRRASDALDSLGIGALARSRVNVLSGGERQRVAIARAVMNEPHVLLADEPTGALDSANADAVMRALVGTQRSDTVLIVVTHNPLCAAFCQKRIVLKDGKIVPEQTSG